MTMPEMAPDYGSDGFNMFEAEADSDPTVALGDGLATEAIEPGEPSVEDAAMQVAFRAAQVKQAEERQANLTGMEQYYNQQQAIHTQRLLAQGVHPTQVSQMAQQLTNQDMKAGAADLLRKRAATQLVAQQYGVPPEMFKGLWTEQEMRQRVAQMQMIASPAGQQAYRAWAQAQIARQGLAQNGVPPQNFNRPGRSGGYGSPATVRKAYADGRIPWSPAVQRAING